MDDLERNPLYRAFLTKFRREFEIACKMSYLIAIPHSKTLQFLSIDQFLANSHILMPSKLLKMHYTPLQVGFSEDIELEGKKLTVCIGKRRQQHKLNGQIVINILGEEIGYNAKNREYRLILIDRPLMGEREWQREAQLQPVSSNQRRPLIETLLAPLSPVRQLRTPASEGPFRGPLRDHADCSKFLEHISQSLTTELEHQIRRLQANYMILSHYLDDAAHRIKTLAELYIPKFERTFCRLQLGHHHNDPSGHYQDYSCIPEGQSRNIRLSVENYIVHLLHGKLIASIHNRYEAEDRKLTQQFENISRRRLSISQLGAQLAFAEFTLSNDIISRLSRLTLLQSPLAIVSELVRLVELISEDLSQSVRFRHLMGLTADEGGGKVIICSDDLIASFVYALVRAKPLHLYSLSRYLDTFGWSSHATNEAAYYTATFQIVVQYIFNYQANHDVQQTDLADNANGNDVIVEPATSPKFGQSFIDSLDSALSLSSASSPSSTATTRDDWEVV